MPVLKYVMSHLNEKCTILKYGIVIPASGIEPEFFSGQRTYLKGRRKSALSLSSYFLFNPR